MEHEVLLGALDQPLLLGEPSLVPARHHRTLLDFATEIRMEMLGVEMGEGIEPAQGVGDIDP